MSAQTNKRAHSSTASECESNTSALDNSVFQDNQSPIKKQDKKKKKKNNTTEKTEKPEKQRKLDDYFKSGDCNSDSDKMEQKLDEINKKLTNMLTKDDHLFIKGIIKATIDEMKDQILSTVVKRIEILEGEVHAKSVEADEYKNKLKTKEEEIEHLKKENENLHLKIKSEEAAREKDLNDLEQYGRRNNIRVSGIPDDCDKQQSASVAALVVKTLNEKGNLNLTETDIDIAHRLGKYDGGKCRSVIVKFVRRQTKIEVMKRSKDLRQNRVFVNEDLTWLNQQVLSSLRLKDKDRVAKCWSFEGQLFAVFQDGTSPVKIQHKDFNYWLNKPWPKRNG